MKFIQISGAGRAGKTTIANILFDIAHDNNYIPVIVPFAQALKNEAANLGYTKEDNPEEYRKFCQKLGADKRKEDHDYWVKQTSNEIKKLSEVELQLKNDKKDRFEHLIIQDDVRYMNEIAFGREHNAYQLFVTPGDRDLPEILDDWRMHESESLSTEVEIGNTDYLDLFNEFVVNAGTNLDLFKRVHERFFTWVTESGPSEDAISKLYFDGHMINDQFLIMVAYHEQIDFIINIDEDLGLTDDEGTEDSDT